MIHGPTTKGRQEFPTRNMEAWLFLVPRQSDHGSSPPQPGTGSSRGGQFWPWREPAKWAISEESRTQSQSDMHWDPDEQSLHRNGQTLLCAVTARQELKVQSIADGVRSSPQPYTDELVRSEGGLSATGLRQPVAAEKALSICMAAHGRRPSPAGGPLAVRRGLFQLEQSGRGRSEARGRGGRGGVVKREARASRKLFVRAPAWRTSNQRPATSNQRPATSSH